MMFYTAELNIGAILVIFWVILSWVMGAKNKKKRRQVAPGAQGSSKKKSVLSEIFSELSKQIQERQPGMRPTVMESQIDTLTPDEPVVKKWKPEQTVVSRVSANEPMPPLDDSEDNYRILSNQERDSISKMGRTVKEMLRSPQDIRTAIVLKEILDKPRAMRRF